MSNLLSRREEQERCEKIDAIVDGITSIKKSKDRIGNIWALKLIAENVARLDEIDRIDGFLPLEVRPPLMIRCGEADLILNKLKKSTGLKDSDINTSTLSLMKKLKGYLND